MKQACLAAAVCEFLGAVLVGARVADTIKNGIIVSRSSVSFQHKSYYPLLENLGVRGQRWRSAPCICLCSFRICIMAHDLHPILLDCFYHLL